MNNKMTPCTLLVLAILVVGATAHSRLTFPPREREPYCAGSKGCAPCLEPESWADNGFSASNPGARWKRGQEVTYVYERNNHKEGMVRLAILPMDKRGDKKANTEFAFMYHCYAGQEGKCPTKEVCGSDESGLQYSVKFTVPTVIPDGVYHFSWSWWGGGDTGSNPKAYTTLYSCSVVEVSGGAPLEASWPVLFEASEHEENEPGKCASHTQSEDECTSSARFCYNKPEIQILPAGFTSAGPSPTRSLTSAMYGATDVPPDSVQPTQAPVETTAAPKPMPVTTIKPPTTAAPQTTMVDTTTAKRVPRPGVKCRPSRR